jgi:predicted alpha/beta hydrolase family esterase
MMTATNQVTMSMSANSVEHWKARANLAEARIAALVEQMTRIADLTEKWADNLASQVNEIARAALAQEKK